MKKQTTKQWDWKKELKKRSWVDEDYFNINDDSDWPSPVRLVEYEEVVKLINRVILEENRRSNEILGEKLATELEKEYKRGYMKGFFEKKKEME